jgi:hypothetical protein
MMVYMFRGPGRVFGFTADAAGANLPAKFAPWSAFKSAEMTKGEARPGVDTDICLDDIEKYGFHVTDAHRRITEDVAT